MGKCQTMATCIFHILQLVCRYEACKGLSHWDQMITEHQILCPLFMLFILHLIQVVFYLKAIPSCAKCFHLGLAFSLSTSSRAFSSCISRRGGLSAAFLAHKNFSSSPRETGIYSRSSPLSPQTLMYLSLFNILSLRKYGRYLYFFEKQDLCSKHKEHFLLV